jgi:hypothetical protein
MMTHFFQSVMIGVICASFVALLLPARYEPWATIDKWIRRLIAKFSTLILEADVVTDTRWSASQLPRITLLKYTLFGILLILIFPMHAVCGTERLIIDPIWDLANTIRHFFVTHVPAFKVLSHTDDWRRAPFELWEICVLAWTVTIFGQVMYRDYIELSELTGSPADSIVVGARTIGWVIQITAVLGILCLIVFQHGILRLTFELCLVGLLLMSDLYFARQYMKLQKRDLARSFIEGLIFIDIPAGIGFLCLLIFVVVCGLKGYSSHWTSSFVAGAAAMNLLLANLAILVLRARFVYQQQPETEVLAKDRQSH